MLLIKWTKKDIGKPLEVIVDVLIVIGKTPQKLIRNYMASVNEKFLFTDGTLWKSGLWLGNQGVQFAAIQRTLVDLNFFNNYSLVWFLSFLNFK